MSENTPEEEPGEPLDLSTLTATDIPDDAPHGVPDHKASRAKRRSRLFPGDRSDDTPPKATPKPRKKPAPRAKRGAFTDNLTQIYVGLGITLMPVDPVCANAIIQSAPECARTLDELAYQNEAVRRALHALTQTSAVGAVFFAHMPILMAVVLHHVPAVQRRMGEMGSQMAENIAQQMSAQSSGETPDHE